MEHRKTRIKISLVAFRVRSVFNPWLKVGPEFFAKFSRVGHTHQAKKVAMMNPS